MRELMSIAITSNSKYKLNVKSANVALNIPIKNKDAIFVNKNISQKDFSQTDIKIKQLKEDFQLAKDEQGIFGKAWNGIKNLFKTEYSSSNIEKAINNLSQNSTNEEFENVRNMIAQYRQKQTLAVDTISTTGATIAAGAAGAKVGAAIGSLIPGAGTIVGAALGFIGGAIIGAVAKVGISQLENMTDDIDDNAWHNDKNLGKEMISGALAGASAMLFGGIAQKVSGLCKKALKLSKQGLAFSTKGPVNVAKTVGSNALAEGTGGAAASAVIADAEYLIKCATDKDTYFSFADLAQTTGVSAVTGGLISAGFGTITGYRRANKYNSNLNCEQTKNKNQVKETIKYDRQTGKTYKTRTEISSKNKKILEECFEYDEHGNIIKYTNHQKGIISTYDYKTKTFTIDKVRYSDGTIRQLNYNVETINPNDIYFTQKSIGKNYKDILQSFRDIGWQGKPVDLIRSKSGKLISIDNRRIAAAREANIDVHAIIHNSSEPLTLGKQMQFRIEHPITKEVIAKPNTWGEAVYNRLYQNGLIISEPKTLFGRIWNRLLNRTSGSIDFKKAHGMPSTSPNPLLDSWKLTLVNLYKNNNIPYSEKSL